MEINTEQNRNNGNIFRRIGHYLVQINIYSDEQSLSVTEQLTATRLNLICMCISIFILITIRSLTPQTEATILTSPTVSQFDELYKQYSSTLSCSCSQVNIPYNTFISLTPQYHQICSSDFISQSWISSLFSINTSHYYPLDFRLSASSQFQILELLCRTASRTVSNALTEFEMQNMISTYVVSRLNFQSQIDSFVQHLQATTIANILRMDQYLELNIAYNNLISSLHTNYFTYSAPGSRVYTTYVGYYLSRDYKNMSDIKDYDSCYINYDSNFYSGFYPNTTSKYTYFYNPLPPPLYSIPGILAGCLPRFSIMQSTLECFYDSNCLNILQSLGIISSLYYPLNASISSRFLVNTTIKSIFDELLIEKWQNNSNFTSYFQMCAPISCSHTFTEPFSAIYIITSILGLLGGLTMVFQLLSFLVVKYIIRRICQICCHQIPIVREEPSTGNRSLRQTVIYYRNQCRESLLTLNVFTYSILLSDVKQKIWATRIYFLFLLLGIVILTIYSFVTLHSESITIYNPSRNQFEQIYEENFLTLSCPCTYLSIPYSKMISIQMRFHQICTSDFIREDIWLLYFDFIPYNNNLTAYPFYSLDFRLNAGSSIFRVMKVLCEFANETVTNALILFNNTQFVNNEPLTSEKFYQQTSALINQFQKQTLQSFLSLFLLVRSTIEDNHFHVSISTNIGYISYVINNTWYVRLRPRSYQNATCNCLTNNQCIRPQGFYCRDRRCGQGNANKTIPGLVISCLPINSLLLSTFECFYNQSCIQMLYDWRLFEIGDLFYPFSLNVTPLDPNLSSQFLPTTKLDQIVSQLLIEEWIVKTDIEMYFKQCQPKICTYTYIARFEVIYVITTIIGLFGGLSIILRLTVPLSIKNIMQQIERRRTMRIRPINQMTTVTQQPSISIRIRQYIQDVHIFNAQINNSIWATRIYFILLFSGSIVVLIFTAISHQVQSYTIRSPSESTFETLYEQHNIGSLSCPCSQSLIQYSTFLAVSVNYHQVCSSDFILSYWWTSLTKRGNEPFLLFDQPLLSNHFRMLSSLCTLSQQMVDNSINALISNEFISVQALTHHSFENQIESILKIFIQQTPIKFNSALEYIIDTLRSNQLEHLFLSNWMLEFTTINENFLLATRPLSYNNNTCTCATSISARCFWPLVFISLNATNITLSGFVGGCLPIDGLRQSTLECLFDSVCLATIGLLINNTTIPIIPNPLNANLITRFPHLTTQVDTIIQELFVEDWFNTTNYSAYYERCSPHACHYMYTERNSAAYQITFLLGIYGGMTISLRFIVVHISKMLLKVQHRWQMG